MTPDRPAPFGAPPRRPWLAAAVFVGALAGAILLVRRYTATDQSQPAPAGHVHGAAAGGDSAMPVTLSAADQQRIGVTFAVVTEAPLERLVRAVAQVTYDETRVRSVTVRVDGYVDRLDANYVGQRVARGEPLLTLHSPMLAAAEGEYLVARRLVRQLEAQDAPDARARAEAMLAAARRRLDHLDVPAAELERLERTGEAGSAFTVYAPGTGFVVEKAVLEGQRVMAGDPLFRLADLDVVWLEGEVFEQDLAAARVGVPVRAEFPALPGVERTGRITNVYPTLNPETRTARIRVELANGDLALKPGMYATIHFSGDGAPVLSVPRSAVLVTGRRNLVFVKRPDGRFTPREIHIGAATDERIEVLGGLAPGDSVVASATFLVDAESNLGTAFGGMGNMPGMDMTAPEKAPPRPAAGAASPAPAPPPARRDTAPAATHDQHQH